MTGGLTLTIPNDRRFLGVVRLVVGGLSAGLDLPYEQVDELQLAVENAARASGSGGEVTLAFEIRDDTVAISIGPLDEEILSKDLPDPSRGIGLQRLLAALVDGVELLEGDGGRWLRLEKRLRDPAPV